MKNGMNAPGGIQRVAWVDASDERLAPSAELIQGPPARKDIGGEGGLWHKHGRNIYLKGDPFQTGPSK